MGMLGKAAAKDRKVTFTAKDSIRCPACDANFRREELFSGRVNAGDLTDELHRLYIPTQAWGTVRPLVYELTVCPSCFAAAWKHDFVAMTPKVAEAIVQDTANRIESVQRVFGPLDFQDPRRLVEGAASYYLAMLTYERFGKDAAPTFKQGNAALRAAWLCDELEAEEPGRDYAWAAAIFRNKARVLYRAAIEYEQHGREQVSALRWLGPDTDKNYGYEGVLYVAGILELKCGPSEDEAARRSALDASKRTIARMFGLGKRSKSKPGPLLDKARDLYDRLKAELNQDDDSDDD